MKMFSRKFAGEVFNKFLGEFGRKFWINAKEGRTPKVLKQNKINQKGLFRNLRIIF